MAFTNYSKKRLKRIPKRESRRPFEAGNEEVSEISSDESVPLESPRTEGPKGSGIQSTTSLRSLDMLELDRSTVEWTFRHIEHETKERAKRHKRANVKFKSNFTDIESLPTLHTIFDDPSFKNSLFFGFYIFFWLGVGFFILKYLINAHYDSRPAIHNGPVYKIFTTGLVRIAMTDLLMYLSIYFVYLVQVLCRMEVFEWRKTGRAITSAYEFVFTFFWIYFASEYVAKDQWIGRVFLVLHMFVLLMKMHSYAFYNGYMWKTLRELQFSEGFLHHLNEDLVELPEGYELDSTKALIVDSIAFCKFELLHQSLALDKAKDNAILDMNSEQLCSTLVKFPSNINLKNFFQYTMFPTLLYALVFRRTSFIRWNFFLEKLCALSGVIFLMLIVAEESIYPQVVACNHLRKEQLSSKDRVAFGLLTLINLIPPLAMEYLFTFYIIWDVILNGIAELSRFADRDFYGPWWSCVDWSDFARYWNKPVHVFLRRHVYHSSISAFSLSKSSAALVTFLISSVVHELIMYIIFGRIRGFLFLFQMGQIPLVILSRASFMRGRKVLGNVICWFGFVTGPAIIAMLYLVF